MEKVWLTLVAAWATQASRLSVQICGRSGWVGEGREQWQPHYLHTLLLPQQPLSTRTELSIIYLKHTPWLRVRSSARETNTWGEITASCSRSEERLMSQRMLNCIWDVSGRDKIFHSTDPPPTKEFQRLSDIQKILRVWSLSHKTLLYLSVLVSLVRWYPRKMSMAEQCKPQRHSISYSFRNSDQIQHTKIF